MKQFQFKKNPLSSAMRQIQLNIQIHISKGLILVPHQWRNLLVNCLLQYGGVVDESGISAASTSGLGVWRKAVAAVSKKKKPVRQ